MLQYLFWIVNYEYFNDNSNVDSYLSLSARFYHLILFPLRRSERKYDWFLFFSKFSTVFKGTIIMRVILMIIRENMEDLLITFLGIVITK